MRTQYSEIADRLRKLRLFKRTEDGKKLTQEALGAALNMSREKIAKIESGKQPLSDPDDIVAFADFYEVSCDYILRGVKTENVQVAQDLGLSNQAIEGFRELKRQKFKALGIFNSFFEAKFNNISDALCLIEDAIELAIQYKLEKTRADEEELDDDPVIQLSDKMSLEYRDVIYTYIDRAGNILIGNIYDYVKREGEKYASQIHPQRAGRRNDPPAP